MNRRRRRKRSMREMRRNRSRRKMTALQGKVRPGEQLKILKKKKEQNLHCVYN